MLQFGALKLTGGSKEELNLPAEEFVLKTDLEVRSDDAELTYDTTKLISVMPDYLVNSESKQKIEVQNKVGSPFVMSVFNRLIDILEECVDKNASGSPDNLLMYNSILKILSDWGDIKLENLAKAINLSDNYFLRIAAVSEEELGDIILRMREEDIKNSKKSLLDRVAAIFSKTVLVEQFGLSPTNDNVIKMFKNFYQDYQQNTNITYCLIKQAIIRESIYMEDYKLEKVLLPLVNAILSDLDINPVTEEVLKEEITGSMIALSRAKLIQIPVVE